MYGYRYKPGGTVMPLPGRDHETAVAEAIERRRQQKIRDNKPSAELVERDGDEWRAVPLPTEDGAGHG